MYFSLFDVKFYAEAVFLRCFYNLTDCYIKFALHNDKYNLIL